MIRKLVKPDQFRPSRLHTEAGELCGLEALPGLLPSALSWVRLKASGKYLVLPWWTWPAIRFVRKQLHPEDKVLEIGSGYSTLWLGTQVASVLSIEENVNWSQRIGFEIAKRGLPAITLVEGRSFEMMRRYLPETAWNVVIIDGPNDRVEIFRELLVQACPRVVVFDDTDMARYREVATGPTPPGYVLHRFKGFKPQTVHPCETSVFVAVQE